MRRVLFVVALLSVLPATAAEDEFQLVPKHESIPKLFEIALVESDGAGEEAAVLPLPETGGIVLPAFVLRVRPPASYRPEPKRFERAFRFLADLIEEDTAGQYALQEAKAGPCLGACRECGKVCTDNARCGLLRLYELFLDE
jgi:hypothetical protein